MLTFQFCQLTGAQFLAEHQIYVLTLVTYCTKKHTEKKTSEAAFVGQSYFSDIWYLTDGFHASLHAS